MQITEEEKEKLKQFISEALYLSEMYGAFKMKFGDDTPAKCWEDTKAAHAALYNYLDIV